MAACCTELHRKVLTKYVLFHTRFSKVVQTILSLAPISDGSSKVEEVKVKSGNLPASHVIVSYMKELD